MRYARIENGVVAEIVTLPEGVAPEEAYSADLAATFVPCADAAVDQRWTYAVDAKGEATFAEPPPYLPTAKQLIDYANARQWSRATAGFVATIGGKPIGFATDEGALGLMDGKVMRLAQPNPPASVNWQTGPTAFVAIAADDFVHAATLVSDYVQETFDTLPAIFSGIAGGTIKAFADIDAAPWPANTATVS